MSQVIVGVGVITRNKQGQILMIKRKSDHGDGEWALPGGKVKFGEPFTEAAIRELLEETGIQGSSPEVISLSNQRRYMEQGVHCVIIGVEVQNADNQKPTIREPNKCEVIDHFRLEELPDNLFEGSAQILEVIKEKPKRIFFLKDD